MKWTKLTPVLRNHKPTMARVLDVAREMLGPANVIEMPAPSMGSEDYAWFAEQVPSAHLRIGSKIDGHETAIHRTDYQFNETMIPLATKLMTRAVLEFLESRLRLLRFPCRERVRERLGRARDVRQLLAGVEPAALVDLVDLHLDRAVGGGFGIGRIHHNDAGFVGDDDVAGMDRDAAARDGAQNDPPSPTRLVVIADKPRHQTGTPYWRISWMSATTPSMITPATFATSRHSTRGRRTRHGACRRSGRRRARPRTQLTHRVSHDGAVDTGLMDRHGRPRDAHVLLQRLDCGIHEAPIAKVADRGGLRLDELVDKGGGELRRQGIQREHVTGLRTTTSVRYHSMTVLARSRSDCGIVRPSMRAVRLLMHNSSFVGCSTGSSPGFAPLRIRSMYSAARL